MTSLIVETVSIDPVMFMERLNDAGLLLTQTMHSQTESRRSIFIAGVDRGVKYTLEKTEPGDLLFSNGLSEEVNEAKTLNQVANSLLPKK